MREDGGMPPRPPASARGADESVLIAVRTIGHPAAVAIVRFLAGRDDALASEVLDATGLQRSTLTRYLRDLRDLDVVQAHGEVGGVPRYSVNRAEVEKITRDHLDYMLGRASDPDADVTEGSAAPLVTARGDANAALCSARSATGLLTRSGSWSAVVAMTGGRYAVARSAAGARGARWL